MANIQGAPLEEQVKKLLESNLKYSKEIYRLSKKTQHYILWGRIMSLISLLLVVIPLVLGVVYLPTLLEKALNGFVPAGLSGQQINNLESLLKSGNLDQEQLLEIINQQGGALNSYQGILNLYK